MLPYEKILELVEAKQLDITTVSLAEVTADFIKYVKALEERQADSDLLANFVAVAAKLLLIKSKTLLPTLELTEEEERDVRELEERLKFYRELKKAAGHISYLWQTPRRCLSRPFLVSVGGFYPPFGLTAKHLLAAFQSTAGGWEKTIKETVKVKTAFISIETKIKELLGRIASAADQKFSQLIAHQSRGEIVAAFLALLQLLKNNQVKVEQNRLFGEIIILKHET